MRNHSNENEFDLHENGPVGETHFHLNGFARRLYLKQRQRVTRKWPISVMTSFANFTLRDQTNAARGMDIVADKTMLKKKHPQPILSTPQAQLRSETRSPPKNDCVGG